MQQGLVQVEGLEWLTLLVEKRALVDDRLVLGKNGVHLLKIRGVLVAEARLLGRQVGRHHDALGVLVLACGVIDGVIVILWEEARLATKSFRTVALAINVVVVDIDVRVRGRKARTISNREQLSLVFRVIAGPI